MHFFDMDCILFLDDGGRCCRPLETAGDVMGVSRFAEEKGERQHQRLRKPVCCNQKISGLAAKSFVSIRRPPGSLHGCLCTNR
jgi:hypothetical protein